MVTIHTFQGLKFGGFGETTVNQLKSVLSHKEHFKQSKCMINTCHFKEEDYSI